MTEMFTSVFSFNEDSPIQENKNIKWNILYDALEIFEIWMWIQLEFICFPCKGTYIIRHYNSSVRLQPSYSTLNFICKWRNLWKYKVDSERQICLRNFSWRFFSYSHNFCLKSTERMALDKYFHIFFFFDISALRFESWAQV